MQTAPPPPAGTCPTQCRAPSEAANLMKPLFPWSTSCPQGITVQTKRESPDSNFSPDALAPSVSSGARSDLGALEADLGADEAAGEGGDANGIAGGEEAAAAAAVRRRGEAPVARGIRGEAVGDDGRLVEQHHPARQHGREVRRDQRVRGSEIGRASGREGGCPSVEILVVDV